MKIRIDLWLRPENSRCSRGKNDLRIVLSIIVEEIIEKCYISIIIDIKR